MRKTLKSFLSMLLTLSMVFSMVGIPVMAEDGEIIIEDNSSDEQIVIVDEDIVDEDITDEGDAEEDGNADEEEIIIDGTAGMQLNSADADENATPVIETGAVAAKIGETGYATLADAIAAATAGATIELLSDITEDVTVSKNVTIDGADYKYTGTMTANTGLTVTVQNVQFVDGGFAKSTKSTKGNYTIKNCSFTDDGDYAYPFLFKGANTIKIEDCTVKGYMYSFLYVTSSAINVSVKNVTVEDCPNYAVYFSSGVTNAMFENLTIKNSNTGFRINNTAKRAFTIKNCKMENVGTSIGESNGTNTITCTVLGAENDFGTAASSQYAKYVLAEEAVPLTAAARYNVTVDGKVVVYDEGAYRYGEPVAQIADYLFGSLEAAVAAVQEGETIVLLADVSETVTVDKTIAIDLNGKNLDGTITLSNPDAKLTAPEGLNVSGAEGYQVVYESGAYMLAAKSYVAKIGETGYETLADAIAAAQAGATIELLADITGDVTVSKSVTIDGKKSDTENFSYTGNIAVTKGSNTAVTVKNVNFVNGELYAIKTDNIKSITVENCTVDNYNYGFLYANKATPTVIVKNVTVNNCSYGFHYVYGSTATLENVVMNNVDTGLYIQNYASKTINLKNCDISSISIWERSGSSGVQTFRFEGENTVGTLSASQYAKYVLTEETATLTAPARYTVTTTADSKVVVYNEGKYQHGEPVAQIADYLFGSLEAAVAAVQEGETIVLLADVSEDVTVDIDKTIELSLNEYTFDGTITLSNPDAKLTAPEDLNVVSGAEGYQVVYESGAYKLVELNPVAKIGENKYETLAAAIAAAKAGETIELLADITGDVTVSKSVTIDGANKSYTGKISVTKGSNTAVTVKNVNFVNGDHYAIKTDSIKSITVENCTVEDYASGFLYANKSTTNVSVKNVTVSNCSYGFHYVYGSTATLENVVMNNVDTGLYIQNYAGKTINLKNCNISSISIWERDGYSGVQTFRFEGENTVGTLSASQCAKYVLTEETATLTAPARYIVTTAVAGKDVVYNEGKYQHGEPVAKIEEYLFGSLEAAVAAVLADETIVLLADVSDDVTVDKTIAIDLDGKSLTGTITLNDSAVKLTAPEGLNVVSGAEGYQVAYEDGAYKLVELNPVAKIGENKYETLAAAIAAAKAGDTIELLADITEDVTVSKSITIDGANKSYTGKISVTKGSNTAVTVKNVNFVNGDHYAIKTDSIKSITVENCTVEDYASGFLYANKSTTNVSVKNVTVNNCSYGFHYVYGSTATLENVTMTNVATGLYIQNYASKTINLKNCNISSISIWERDGYSGVQTFKFEGENTVGTLSASQYAKYVLTEETATLTAPARYIVTTAVAGKDVVYNEGKYQHGTPVAQIADYLFGSLKAAVAAVLADETIVLLADVSEDVTVDKTIAIDLNGKSLTGTITLNGIDVKLTAPEGLKVVSGAEGYQVAYEDGAYKLVELNPVAKIGENKYATLADAIAAAQAGDKIELLADITEDVTVSKSVTIDGKKSDTENFSYTGKMTLNKVNVTIENVNFVKGNIYKTKKTGVGGNFTIRNCTFDGQGLNTYAVELGGTTTIVIENVIAKNYGYGFLQVPASNNSLSVKDVTVSDVNYGFKVDYNTSGITMENVIAKENIKYYGIYASNYVKTNYTITNCEFSSIELWDRDTGKTETFEFVGANTVGTLDNSQYAKYVLKEETATLTAPAGYTVTTTVEGKVVAYVGGVYQLGEPVAAIGDTMYGSIQDALNAAADDDTITILKDCELDGYNVQTEKNYSYETLLIVDGKNVTIDFAGYTVAVKHGDASKYAGGIASCLESVVFVYENAGLTLIDSTEGAKGGFSIPADDNVSVYSIVYNHGGEFTIENGTYFLEKGYAKASTVYADDDHTTAVKGGIFTLGNAGEESDTKPWIFNTEGKNDTFITVTGGTYNQDLLMNYGTSKDCEVTIPEGYVLVDNGDGTWTVKEGAVAARYGANNEYIMSYETVTEALAEANSGETVKVLKETEEYMVVVLPDITLDLNGKTLNATYVIGLNGSDVVDNSEDNVGLLKVAKTNITLATDNAQLPVYNGTDGYVFTPVMVKSMISNITNDGFKVTWRPYFCTEENYVNNVFAKVEDYFANDADNTGVEFAIVLDFVNKNGIAVSQKFVVKDEMVETTFYNKKAFGLTVYGFADDEGNAAYTDVGLSVCLDSGTTNVEVVFADLYTHNETNGGNR